MSDLIIVTTLKSATILIGFALIAIASRAYFKSGVSALLTLAAAVGLLTVGVFAEAMALNAFGLTMDQAHVLEAVFTFSGFAVFFWSAWRRR